MHASTTRSELTPIRHKLERGERLTQEDGERLFATSELSALGALADQVARDRHGRTVYYNVNRHVNYSNLCKLSCLFCAFAKKRGDADGYEFSLAEILRRARQAVRQGASELHIVGGLHPDWPYAYYPELLRVLKRETPSLHLKAFTAVEIDYFAKLADRDVDWVLEDLMAAGLDSMPGGGAEVLTDRVWRKIYRAKMGPDRWLDVIGRAHRHGLRSNATLLYGHIETAAERVTHCLRLRELQDETQGFLAFIPLRFHPQHTHLEGQRPIVRPAEALRVFAVSRLLLDNVPHLKAYWIMHGLDTAQLALSFGANDLDGTVVEEKITHMAGGEQTAPEGVDEASLRALIEEAGRLPVRRDTLYRRWEDSPERAKVEAALAAPTPANR